LALACSPKEATPPKVEHSLTVLELDSLWIYDSKDYRRVSVRLSPALPIEDIYCVVIDDSGHYQNTFWLSDNGGGRYLNDDRVFTDTLTTGDAFAGDGIYSRRINAGFVDRPGRWQFYFVANVDALTYSTTRAYFVVRTNSAPQFGNLVHPDTLPSGSFGRRFAVTVTDSDGAADIVAVQLVRRTTETLVDEAVYPMHPAGSEWEWSSRPEVAVRLMTGSYLLQMRAQDRFQRQSNGWSVSDPFEVFLENSPPRIASIEGSDTVWVAESDTVFFSYRLVLTDDQTAADLDTLRLVISDPNRVVARFAYFDDGTGLDTTAGDGIFVAGFSVDRGSRTNVIFTFDWTPHDKALQRGETVRTTLVILRREGGAAPLGRGSWNNPFTG